MGNESAKPQQNYGLLGKKKFERLAKLVKKQYPHLDGNPSMLVADNTLPDCPIVMCNDEFLALTYYDREDVLGFNCRFLQGRHTDPATVKRVRQAVDNGEELEVNILNYRKDGVPFANKFRLLPVRGSSGNVKYFLAVQRDITAYTLESAPTDWVPVEVAVYLEKHGVHQGLLPLIVNNVDGAAFLKADAQKLVELGVKSEEVIGDILRVQRELMENGAYLPSDEGVPFSDLVHRSHSNTGSYHSDYASDDEDESTCSSVIGRVHQPLPESFSSKKHKKKVARKESASQAADAPLSADTGADATGDPFASEAESESEREQTPRDAHAAAPTSSGGSEAEAEVEAEAATPVAGGGRDGAKAAAQEEAPLKRLTMRRTRSRDSALATSERRSTSTMLSMRSKNKVTFPRGLEHTELMVEEHNHALFAEHFDALAKTPAVRLVRIENFQDHLDEVSEEVEEQDELCTCVVCPVSAQLELDRTDTLSHDIASFYGAKVQRFARHLIAEHRGELPVGACFIRELEARQYIMFAVVCRTWSTPFFSHSMPYQLMRSIHLEVHRHNEAAIAGTARRGLRGSIDSTSAYLAESPSPLRSPARGHQLPAPITRLCMPVLAPDTMRSPHQSQCGPMGVTASASAHMRLGTSLSTSGLRRTTSAAEGASMASTGSVLAQNISGAQVAHQTRLAIESLREFSGVAPPPFASESDLIGVEAKPSEEARKQEFAEHVVSGALTARGLRTAEELEWLVKMVAADEEFGRDRRLQHVAAIACAALLSTQPLFSHLATDIQKAITTCQPALQHVLRMAQGGHLRLSHELLLCKMEQVKKVASGAAGSVYRAVMPYRGVRLPVAIKLMHDSADVREFHSEVAIMSLFAHPRLVRLYGCGRAESTFFHVTEYAAQGSLFDSYLKPKRRAVPFPDERRLRILLEVAEGIEALHERCVIHRDLKSMNVLLFDDAAKIADYGTSKIVSNQMTAGVGTSAWMAPEVIMGGNYGTSSDLYSFAMIMFEVYARRVPFEHVKFTGQLLDLLKRDERPSLPSSVPAAVRKLCTRCWASNPSKRPSASEAVRVLREAYAAIAAQTDSPRSSSSAGAVTPRRR